MNTAILNFDYMKQNLTSEIVFLFDQLVELIQQIVVGEIPKRFQNNTSREK
jgi:hypothetical protein